jgi:flagellar biosynthesis/type III secretory pathway protein FliH
VSVEYWKIIVQEALHEQGIVANPRQIEGIAEYVRSGVECEYETSGRAYIPHPLEHQNKKLQQTIESFEKEAMARIERAKDDQKVVSYWDGYHDGKREAREDN